MNNQLLLNEIGHLLSYTGVALSVYLIKREYFSVRNFFIGTLTAFFIDIDHLFDYILKNGLDINLGKFYSGEYFGDLQTIILPFHAWEFAWILLLIWLICVTDKKKHSWLLFIVIGFFVHLIFDVYSNNMHWTFYFISYRLFVS